MKLGRTIRDTSLRDILHALDRGLTHVENISCVFITKATGVGANTEFTVDHTLGRVPTHYGWNVEEDTVVYDSRRSDWTATQIFLKCTSPSVTIRLILF